MKKAALSVSIIILIISVISCNSQPPLNAKKKAGDFQALVKSKSPGYISTTAGYYMKAKINGESWVADELMASDKAGKILGKLKGAKGESISLPFDLRYVKTGAITQFRDQAVDIFTKNNVGIWEGHEGEMMYTKVGNNYAEGKFYVAATAKGTNKRLMITDGVFRIPLSGQ